MANVTRQQFVSKSVLNDIMAQPKLRAVLGVEDDKSVAGWFMGAKGENLNEVKNLVSRVIELTLEGRKELFPTDPEYITNSVKESPAYNDALSKVKENSRQLQAVLSKYSVPFSSLRYQGHMTWDITLPSILGYLSGMLQNQNNVTPQAAPATTLYEIAACNDIARMIGFRVRPLEEKESSQGVFAWSHIASGGTVANIESVWAARELKFMPLGIKYATEPGQPLESIRDSLTLPNGSAFCQASAWQLLNLKQDDALCLPEQIADLMGDKLEESDVWKLLGERYSLNARGMNFFYQHYLAPEDIKAPAIIVPSTKHYSWVKSTSLLGMGGGQQGLTEAELTDISVIKDDGLLNVYVNEEGKVKTDLLQRVLDTCRAHKKPVVLNVAVVGTTEEGAVDPVEDLLAIRAGYRKQAEPFDYALHTDAAWGGYFTACIREPFELESFPVDEDLSIDGMFSNQNSWFRESVYRSMTHIHQCDSVTIDPHKMGYIPYPAGSLTYRNDKIINLLSFSAPYISSEGSSGEINTRNIGDSGIEGSKPGAAATAVFLSHQVIRPDIRGYGKIINQSMLNAKLFYLYLVTMDIAFPDDKFDIVMLNPLSPELHKQREALANVLWGQKKLQATDLHTHKDVECFLRHIAGDQNIVDYVFVDKKDNSAERTKVLNNTLFNKLSVEPGKEVGDDQIFVSMTTFGRSNYGDVFINALGERLYDNPRDVNEIPCIRSVVLDPWAIYTHEKGENGMFNFFTDVFLPRLRQEVNSLCANT